MWLFAIFVAVPIIEIGLFIQVGGWLGLWPTLAIILGTAVLGSWLLRWQGTEVLRDLQREMGAMGNPVSPLAHGALVLLGAVMMILPGFFTDVMGMALMVPALRALVIRALGARFAAAIRARGVVFGGMGGMRGAADDGVVDGQWQDVTPGADHPEPGHQRTLH